MKGFRRIFQNLPQDKNHANHPDEETMGNEWKIQTTNHVRVVSMMQQCWEKEAKNCLVIEKDVLSLAYS
jgi:hypothetical protein